MKSSIGVLITYFNEGPMLSECLKTLAAQTSPPDEILIYDDASDLPPEKFIPPGLRARIIRGERNLGPAHGRNELLKITVCDYVHFHDADDWFHPDWCRQVREALARQQVDALFTEVCSYRNGALHSGEVLGLRRLPHYPDLLAFAIDSILLTQSGTYRKSLALQAGGYRADLWQAEDYDFHLRLAAAGPRFDIVLQPLVCQRLHAASRSTDQVACWRDLVRSLELVTPGLPARYRPRICERLASAGCCLLRLGDAVGGAKAISLARTLAQPKFDSERRMFRLLARTIGPEKAVGLSNVYRSVVPHAIRRWAAGQTV